MRESWPRSRKPDFCYKRATYNAAQSERGPRPYLLVSETGPVFTEVQTMFGLNRAGTVLKRGVITSAAVLVTASALASELHGQTDGFAYDASPLAAAAGALVGGVVGSYAGVLTGNSSDCYEFCSEVVFGFLAGEMLGVGLGAHLFNGGRGNGLLTIGTSVGVGLAGILATGAADSGPVLLVSAVAQVALVTAIQVRSSPRVAVSPMVAPSPDGMKAGLTLRW